MSFLGRVLRVLYALSIIACLLASWLIVDVVGGFSGGALLMVGLLLGTLLQGEVHVAGHAIEYKKRSLLFCIFLLMYSLLAVVFVFSAFP